MIVYEATKQEFLQHVHQDILMTRIIEQFEKKLGKSNKFEIRAWDNSILHMYRVLNDEEIRDDASVAIEY